jgi:hypothetical protein
MLVRKINRWDHMEISDAAHHRMLMRARIQPGNSMVSLRFDGNIEAFGLDRNVFIHPMGSMDQGTSDSPFIIRSQAGDTLRIFARHCKEPNKIDIILDADRAAFRLEHIHNRRQSRLIESAKEVRFGSLPETLTLLPTLDAQRIS